MVMVRFEEDRLVIEIESYSAVETWRGLMSQMIDLMGNECVGDRVVEKYELYELLLALLPQCDQVKGIVSEDGPPAVMEF